MWNDLVAASIMLEKLERSRTEGCCSRPLEAQWVEIGDRAPSAVVNRELLSHWSGWCQSEAEIVDQSSTNSRMQEEAQKEEGGEYRADLHSVNLHHGHWRGAAEASGELPQQLQRQKVQSQRAVLPVRPATGPRQAVLHCGAEDEGQGPLHSCHPGSKHCILLSPPLQRFNKH